MLEIRSFTDRIDLGQSILRSSDLKKKLTSLRSSILKLKKNPDRVRSYE